MARFWKEKSRRSSYMSKTTFFEAKTVLFREGEISSDLMIIKAGEVVCLKASKERLIPVFLAKEKYFKEYIDCGLRFIKLTSKDFAGEIPIQSFFS